MLRTACLGLMTVALLAGTAGCQASKQEKAASQGNATTTAVSSAPSSSIPSADPTTAAATSATPSGSSASASVVPTPDVGDPCSLLPTSEITSALGVQSATGQPNSRAQFAGCNYALTDSATLIMYLATERGPQIYGAAQAGGGFSNVSGVGTQAAYNSEDGRFIASTDKNFVELTIPSDLKGLTAAKATQAGQTLANKVLSELH